MKVVFGMLVVGAVAYYFYHSTGSPLSGEWKEDGGRIVESMIESGRLEDNSRARSLVSTLSDTTYIFTDDSLGISFVSNPSFNEPPVPYEIVEKTESSVTISYFVEAGKYNRETFHFTDDGGCIYVKRDNFNDYFCKKI